MGKRLDHVDSAGTSVVITLFFGKIPIELFRVVILIENSQEGRTAIPSFLLTKSRKINQIQMNFPATVYGIALLASTLLCTTVFGVVLVFYIVVMPGIAKFDDGNYLRAFQFIDGIIQNSEPTFVTCWMGSIVAALVVFIVNIFQESHHDPLAFVAVALYGIGQVATFTINIPRNNRVKMLDIDSLTAEEKNSERLYFEGVWNRTNLVRTVLFGVSSVMFALLLHDN